MMNPPLGRAARTLAVARARVQNMAASPLLQKSGLSVLDQAIVSGSSFATSVILGRCSSREELGAYYLALSIVFFARGVQEQVVSAPYMIYCSRKQGAALAEYAGSALVHQCAMMLLTAAVLAAALALNLVSVELQAALWLLVLAAPLLLMRDFLRQMCFAHLQLRGALVLDAAVGSLQLGGLVVLAAVGGLTVTTTLAAMAVAAGLPAAVWLTRTPQPMVGRLRSAVRDFAFNWTFARWALASQLLASTTPYVMPWVVAFTHGQAETGTLGACMTLVGLANMFLLGLCNFLSPRAARAFSEGGLAELQGVLRKTALLFGVSLGGIAVAGFAVGGPIAALVYGPEFAGTGLVIGVLSLGVLANSMGVTAGNGLWALERPSANFVADVIALVLALVATVVLVPRLGPLGAALAILIGTTADAMVRMWILRQTMREFAAGRAAA
jgi:O-antigen/teichoic acid export membrane protein